ncbi:MAG TPA: hypothetical protein PK536_13930 [Ignavibacteria bacterium]|nr:hypothetical protein [Bacteroidota bacterium]HRI86538.1 hypothetical protein [Ignavibacteria bacterium]HRJ98291.1 hypothetical protein [Ignavibacteria bacterium]
MDYKIILHNPCTENFEEMEPGTKSVFCQKCKKDVIDFTGMNRNEIIEYMLSVRDNKICGRINSSEIDFSYSELVRTVDNMNRKYNIHQLSFRFLIAGLLFLAGCNNEPINPDPAVTANKKIDNIHLTPTIIDSVNNWQIGETEIISTDYEDPGNCLDYKVEVIKEEIFMGMIVTPNSRTKESSKPETKIIIGER